MDRVRILRAFATLVAYSVRSHKGGKMWIRAEREDERSVRVDIDVPAPEHAPPELEAMLSTQTSARKRDHRGLALGLRLARSVVELHGGEVRVVARGKKGAMICVTLPTVTRPLRRPKSAESRQLRQTPPPASGPASGPGSERSLTGSGAASSRRDPKPNG